MELETLSLVNHYGSRFSLLPLTKQYAREDLTRNLDFKRKATERWVEWLISYAQRHGGEKWDWRGYEDLDHEIENILGLIELGIEEEWPEVLVALRSIVFYMAIRGRWSRMVQLGREALRFAKKVGDYETAGFLASQSLGWILGQLKHLDEAAKYAEEGVESNRIAGKPRNIALSMRILGQIRRKQERFVKALSWYENALELAHKENDEGLKGNLLGELGKLMRDMGKYEKAWEFLKEATRILESEEEDKPVYASLLGHMGTMAYRQGDLSTAKEYCERCLHIFDDIEGVTEITLTLAKIRSEEGSTSEAIRLAQRSVTSFQRLGMMDEMKEAESLLNELNAETPTHA